MCEKSNLIKHKKQDKKAYDIKSIIEEAKTMEKKNNYYEESIYALIEYMKNNEQNPSENKWDNYAIKKRYLSSKTIGYLSGLGFNKLCRKTRKQLNKKKRQKED